MITYNIRYEIKNKERINHTRYYFSLTKREKLYRAGRIYIYIYIRIIYFMIFKCVCVYTKYIFLSLIKYYFIYTTFFQVVVVTARLIFCISSHTLAAKIDSIIDKTAGSATNPIALTGFAWSLTVVCLSVTCNNMEQ